MQYFRTAVIIAALIILSLATYAQDIIVTTDARKIEAKIIEVSKSTIRYKESDNLEGPTFILGTDEISSVIYSNGKVVLYNQSSQEQTTTEVPDAGTSSQPADTASSTHIIYTASEFHEDTLPAFSYTKVNVPGKKYKKKRYIGGNMVLTEKEFAKFIEHYCPEAYAYHKKANLFLALECLSILVGVIPVVIFAVFCIENSSKVLPTYNSLCAGHPVTMRNMNSQQYFHDRTPIATITQ